MAKYGCDRCGLYFEAKQELDEHAGSHSETSKFGRIKNDDSVDDKESMLLKRTMEEEKARKRTRGPYRKSAAA
jgi:hypothetical protein